MHAFACMFLRAPNYYPGNKILMPGDIENEGWQKAFESRDMQDILEGINFFMKGFGKP